MRSTDPPIGYDHLEAICARATINRVVDWFKGLSWEEANLFLSGHEKITFIEPHSSYKQQIVTADQIMRAQRSDYVDRKLAEADKKEEKETTGRLAQQNLVDKIYSPLYCEVIMTMRNLERDRKFLNVDIGRPDGSQPPTADKALGSVWHQMVNDGRQYLIPEPLRTELESYYRTGEYEWSPHLLTVELVSGLRRGDIAEVTVTDDGNRLTIIPRIDSVNEMYDLGRSACYSRYKGVNNLEEEQVIKERDALRKQLLVKGEILKEKLQQCIQQSG